MAPPPTQDLCHPTDRIFVPLHTLCLSPHMLEMVDMEDKVDMLEKVDIMEKVDMAEKVNLVNLMDKENMVDNVEMLDMDKYKMVNQKMKTIMTIWKAFSGFSE